MITINYFVHSTTIDNEQGLATGWLPGVLSAKGKQQAAELGNKVAKQRFDVVFCSDLQRAIDSAQLGFGEYTIIHDDRLREANYGDWNGQPHTFKDTMDDFIHAPFPNGESYRDVEQRVEAFCNFLAKKYQGQRVAIVAHQAPQLALDVLLKGKSWEQAIAEDWRRTGAWQPGWLYVIP